jgi:hypothetical protein
MVIAFALLAIGASTRADADTGVKVFPGMEIHQGSTICTLGFVEVRLRFALTVGQCDGGPTVTDSHGDVVGVVAQAHRNAADDTAADGSMAGVDYEVIKLDPNANPTDLLPTGRQLQSTPGLVAQPALPVCHFGISTAQTCGRVGSVSNGRFVIQDVPVDKRDHGGPVYTLTDNNRATIVGFFDAVSGSAPAAESWQAVMEQLYVDLRAPSSPQLPAGVRVAGWHQRVRPSR